MVRTSQSFGGGGGGRGSGRGGGRGGGLHDHDHYYGDDSAQEQYYAGERFADEALINDDSSYDQAAGYYDTLVGSQSDDHDQATYYSGDYSTGIPEIFQLNHLCANAHAPRVYTLEARREAEESWEPVRDWLRTHTAEQVRQAAEQRGESAMTALHFACRNQPPLDIINVFLSIAHETAQFVDQYGWLPVHYACACSSETKVIMALAESFPESKTTVDRRGRTPLHFALGNQNPDQLVSPDVIAILSSSGAASYPDDNGMLPLHYACAYGASEEALFVLTDSFPDAISTRDRNGRTPLHFALSNAGRKTSPGAVRHLLDLDANLANSNGGPLPLRVLSEFSLGVKRSNVDVDRESVQKCLELLLNANPKPTADFFTALQSLPNWLSDRAVVMSSVQILLNEKISQRFPTFILMLDFDFLIFTIIFYSWNVLEGIRLRFNDNLPNAIGFPVLSPLYMGAAYFMLREIISMISLLSLKSFHIWVYDPSKLINVIFIFLVLYWTILMQTGGLDPDQFRRGTALSVIFLWLKVLAFLRNVVIDFAVFAGGVFYVFRRLVAFLTALGVILIGFARMFVTLYQETEYCTQQPERPLWEKRCGTDEDRPYCSDWNSFITVYTMLLGEVDETAFQDSNFATCLFVLFMFLVVILLANVLIAIVTDSYKVIQNRRAAIVFWSNRLDFIAEMDAIANGPWKKRVKRAVGLRGDSKYGGGDGVFGREFYKRLMDLFEDEIEDDVMSVEFWAYTLLRVVAAVFIVPCWLILGLITFGLLWPPQIREAIFTSTVSKHSSESEREDELRKTQVVMLQREVNELEEELWKELKLDRTHIVQMKSSIAERRAEIVAEMKHIKRIMTMLFEQHSAFG